MPNPPRALVRGLLRLPDAWLLRLAGGKPTVIEGRMLHPALQLLAASAARQRPMSDLAPAEARAVGNEAFRLLSGKRRPGVAVEPVSIPGTEGEIPARLYRPERVGARPPLLLFFHQGGFVVGSLDWCEAFCSILADTARCLVVSVDYRLAPEHRFPAASQDALSAWSWASARAANLGADPRRIGVAGESAGGNLAALITHEVRRRGGQAPVLQLLIYPWVEGRARTRSYDSFAEAWPVNLELMDWFIRYAFEKPSDLDDPRLNPLREPELADLPPALVFTAGFDPLCDEGAAYADKLAAAGVPVRYRCYDALTHSFTAMGAVPDVARAQQEIAEETRRLLQEA